MKSLTGIARWYDQMDHTLHVMLDRSMWFGPIYEAISKDQFRPIVSNDRRLRGHEQEIEEPLRFACGYAQTIFLCTAFETFFIWHYGNAVTFLVETGRGSLTDLPLLRRWVEGRKDLKDWESWQTLKPTARFRTLTSLSFSNLKMAEQYFSEIYGDNCFKTALSKPEYEKLGSVYQNLQSERNSILHRGGEHKSGDRVEVPPSNLQDRFVLGEWLGLRLLKLSAAFREFWLGVA
jgi:hypothetical protein